MLADMRRIDMPVPVEAAPDGTPKAFTWRRVRYRVLHLNEPWHLSDRWWVTAAEADRTGGQGYSDRYYYRVCARATGSSVDLWCDMYQDRASPGLWVLERVLD